MFEIHLVALAQLIMGARTLTMTGEEPRTRLARRSQTTGLLLGKRLLAGTENKFSLHKKKP